MQLWPLYAMTAAAAIALAHHLGLVAKIAEVCAQIASCQRCSVFWGLVALALLFHWPLISAVAVAIVAAYSADWLGLLFFDLNNIYTRLWTRRNKRLHR